ncbi:hypothetical protein J2125_000061 [Erwinia toletana]|uniref:Uncharacterized protein n=1 Tax=Winslowiella toletana TaxID=92490 RepID=A0ABS4P2J8_9GAMM|nr:hypothetical protein [Winslowiella toletana]MBP2166869.1 hypothetical protein [Winslowiella toletana]
MLDAKELANRMADAINVKSNFLRSFAGGALELPVDLYYLGYDFFDTENRTANSYDTERAIRLVKHGLANRKGIEKIANIIIHRYLDKVDVEKIKHIGVNSAGSLAGSIMTNRLILGNIGSMFAANLVAKMLIGFSFSTLIGLGAFQSRAIYTSRELKQRDQELQNYLQRLGDLDLLYFLIEKRVKPFEDVTAIWAKNRRLFDEISQYFLQKMRLQ